MQDIVRRARLAVALGVLAGSTAVATSARAQGFWDGCPADQTVQVAARGILEGHLWSSRPVFWSTSCPWMILDIANTQGRSLIVEATSSSGPFPDEFRWLGRRVEWVVARHVHTTYYEVVASGVKAGDWDHDTERCTVAVESGAPFALVTNAPSSKYRLLVRAMQNWGHTAWLPAEYAVHVDTVIP